TGEARPGTSGNHGDAMLAGMADHCRNLLRRGRKHHGQRTLGVNRTVDRPVVLVDKEVRGVGADAGLAADSLELGDETLTIHDVLTLPRRTCTKPLKCEYRYRCPPRQQRHPIVAATLPVTILAHLDAEPCPATLRGVRSVFEREDRW